MTQREILDRYFAISAKCRANPDPAAGRAAYQKDYAALAADSGMGWEEVNALCARGVPDESGTDRQDIAS